MLRFARPLLTALVLYTASLPVTGQTTPGTTTPTGPMVTELSLERQLALTTTFTSTELAVPADKQQGIASGALLVRERLIYNPSGSTLTSTIFTVQPGAALPTPINANLTGSILGTYTLNVEKVYATTTPENTVAFTGTVAGASNGGVLGNVAGLPFLISMAFTNDTPAKVTELVHVIGGRVVVYTKDASGTLVVQRPTTPVTPPAEGPQVVITAPTVTVDQQIVLDASKTTDASGTSLSFVWRNVNKSAAILNPNTAVATVQFGEGLGEYMFELTVTNGNGVSVKKTVTVMYFGR